MVSTADILNANILIVDDQEANVQLLEQMLREAGYRNLTSTTDPYEVCTLHRKNRNDLIEKALELSHTDVSHIPLHNQIIPWALKKNVDVVHRADNRIDWRLVKVN